MDVYVVYDGATIYYAGCSIDEATKQSAKHKNAKFEIWRNGRYLMSLVK